MRPALAVVLAALLSGCGVLPKSALDNVLLVTLPSAAPPRAFVASTYGPLSIGTELREADARTLADAARLIHYVEAARAQAAAGAR